jgi:beta-glucosidase
MLSGGGSAQVDPPGGGESRFGGPAIWFPTSPMKAIRAKAPKAKVEYNDGADLAAAAALAKASEIAIVFVNQPTSEGRDLPTLTLPSDCGGRQPQPGGQECSQDKLVSAVAAANPHTLVVLETGGPAAMPWIGEVSAAIEVWYPGIRGDVALANILFGDVNPTGKLPVSFAKSDADLPHPQIAGLVPRPAVVPAPTPAPGVAGAAPGAPAAGRGGRGGGGRGPAAFDIDYTEGLKVGYKWFDAENKEPLFAFGYGLSYTTYTYSGLKAGIDSVTFTVRNTGKRAGAEIVQVYAGLPSAAQEPPKRLVAWDKIPLAPGESKTVTLPIEPKFLSVFNEQKDDWELLPGEYKIFVGGSSRATPLTATVKH